MTECVSLTRYTAVLSSKAAAVPKPCRFWDWFWCSTVRYTKRRRPSASECNCWSNCQTNHPHASSESSYQGLWKLFERCYHPHPISLKLRWSVVRKSWASYLWPLVRQPKQGKAWKPQKVSSLGTDTSQILQPAIAVNKGLEELYIEILPKGQIHAGLQKFFPLQV